MFVVLAYDVKVKRVSRVRKIAEKYLQPVQRSVFDGHITDRALTRLQEELARTVDCDEDAVVIYRQTFTGDLVKYQLGRHQDNENLIL